VIWAAHTYIWTGRAVEADSVAATLEPLRDSLPPWDLAMLDYYRARSINDWEGAYHAIGRAVQVAPRSEWSYLMAGAANQLGRPSEALRILIDTGPGLASAWYPYWSTRLRVRHRLGDYDGELEDLALARADLDVGQVSLEEVEVRAFAGLGRADDALAKMEELFAAAPVAVSSRAGILRMARSEFLAHGRPDIAEEMVERELRVRLAQPEAARTPRQRIELARVLYWARRLEEARGLIESLPLEHDPGDILGYRALIAAAQGRSDEALRLSDRVAETYPGPAAEYWNVIWQARIASALGEEERAVALLEGAINRNRMGRFDWLGHDPDFAPLFPLPRFQALLRTDQRERPGA
jgi:tetratricopeptide (TPR) repeat protein